MPPQLVTAALNERGQMARDAAKDARASAKGPELEKRLEALALVESQKKYGQAMNYAQLTAKDPGLAGRLYRHRWGLYLLVNRRPNNRIGCHNLLRPCGPALLCN